MCTIERYLAPLTLEEAAQAATEGNATLLAGGTDLMPQTRAAARRLEAVLLNINRIDELKGIMASGDTIRLGALTTVAEILESDLLVRGAEVLVETADCFASGQVRNSATIGGNICNASPAADLVVPLLLLEAEVELVSWRGGNMRSRCISLCEFFTGPGQTRRERNEILTSIHFRVSGEGTVAGFKKFGTRPALDIAVISVGILARKKNGRLQNVKVAYGAVAPTPIRGWKTEAALEGSAVDEVCSSSMIAAMEADISPISDVRASAWYRKQVLCEMTRRLLRDVNGS